MVYFVAYGFFMDPNPPAQAIGGAAGVGAPPGHSIGFLTAFWCIATSGRPAPWYKTTPRKKEWNYLHPYTLSRMPFQRGHLPPGGWRIWIAHNQTGFHWLFSYWNPARAYIIIPSKWANQPRRKSFGFCWVAWKLLILFTDWWGIHWFRFEHCQSFWENFLPNVYWNNVPSR